MRSLHRCIIPALIIHVFAGHAVAQEPRSEIFQERVRNEKNGEILIETIFPSRKEYEAPCTKLAENARFTRRPGPVRFWITVDIEYAGNGQDLPIKSYGGFGNSDHILQVREGKSFGSLETAGITKFLASLGLEEFAETIRGIHCIMVGSTQPQLILFTTEDGASIQETIRRTWKEDTSELPAGRRVDDPPP